MPCDCDCAYPDPDDCPRCSAPETVDDLFLPRTETSEQVARRERVMGRLLAEHRVRQQELDAEEQAREAAGDVPWFQRRPAGVERRLRPTDVQLAMPQLPDGPDDLLAEIAEMEAVVARERRELDDRSGARRCRYCEEPIPPGPAPGVHPECLPEELPEGARSCTGCAEVILSADEEFDHDFCEADYEQLVDEDGEELFGTLAPPFGVEELVWFGGEDNDPTEPLLALPEVPEAPVRASDVVLCPCKRQHTIEFVARNDGQLGRTISTASVTCACGMLISVAFSWSRRCCVAVKFNDRDVITLVN